MSWAITSKIFSGINDWNTKVDFLYQPNPRHTVKFGLNYTYHEFTPGNATGRSGEVVFEPDQIFKQYSNEGALYLSDDFEVSELLDPELILDVALQNNLPTMFPFTSSQSWAA